MTTSPVLVTGATGFLGLNIVRELLAANIPVVAMHRRTSEMKYLRRFEVTCVEAALEDADDLEAALPRDIAAVIHVAADLSSWHGHRDRQTRANVDGTRHLVEAALRRGVRRFVHTSTTGVYGLPRDSFDETAPRRGLNSGFHYQHTKALAEDVVTAAMPRGLEPIILQPANIVGAFDANSSWSRLIRMAVENKLPAVPPGASSFCHAGAVAKAHVAALTKGRPGESYILGGADATYVDLVRTLADIIGRPLAARTVPAVILRAYGGILGLWSRLSRREPFLTPDAAAYVSARLYSRSDKAIRELGYEPTTLRAMLEDSYRWLEGEGLLNTATSPAPPSRP